MEDLRDFELLLKSVGSNIKRYREARAYTLDDLEFHTGIDSSDLNKMEFGQRNITVKSLLRLARGLGVEVRDFFD